MNLIYTAFIVITAVTIGVIIGYLYLPKQATEITCHTFDIATESPDGRSIIFGLTEMCVSDVVWSPIWSKLSGTSVETPLDLDQGSLQ